MVCISQNVKMLLASIRFPLEKPLVERTLETGVRRLTVMNAVSLETQRILNFPEDG